MSFLPISLKTAEHYTWGGECDAWFLLKDDAIHIIQERMPSGSSEAMHVHCKSRQLFYVLRGELTIVNQFWSAKVRVGHAVVVEPNISHRVMNSSDENIEFLVVSCPPSHGDRVETFGRGLI